MTNAVLGTRCYYNQVLLRFAIIYLFFSSRLRNPVTMYRVKSELP